MHHWVQYCVNRCMKSKVNALTSFVTDAQTPSISMSPQWLRHGGGQKYSSQYHDIGNLWKELKVLMDNVDGPAEEQNNSTLL